MKKRRLRAITLPGAIDKSPILLSLYGKNYHFDTAPKIILNFGGINKIFVDYTWIRL